MNNKAIAWLLGLLVLIAAVVWMTNRAPEQDAAGDVGALPWLEVVSDDVYIEFPGTGQKTTARTGDELPDGAGVSTNSKGVARVHFPDGSFARVEPNTTLTVEHVSFDEATDKLSVRLALKAGMVWSKVVSLATSDSSWEVETSQAVAAVRGTAFGAEATGAATLFVGVEDNVEVSDGDESKLLTPEHEMLMSDDGAMPDPSVMSETMKQRADYKTFVQEHEAFNGLVARLREKHSNERDFRKALRREVIKQFEQAVHDARAARPASGNAVDGDNNGIPTPGEVRDLLSDDGSAAPSGGTPSQTPSTPTRPSAGGSSASETYVRLEIDPSAPREIDEDTIVTFRAFLVDTNGARTDVTTEAAWRVVGNIGSLERPGVLSTKLTPAAREFGQVPGGMAATITKGGQRFEAATELFKVKADIAPNPVTEG